MLTLVVLLYIFFALTFTIAKSSVLYMTPLFFIGTRMAVAGILFLGYIYKQQYNKVKENKQNLKKQLNQSYNHEQNLGLQNSSPQNSRHSQDCNQKNKQNPDNSQNSNYSPNAQQNKDIYEHDYKWPAWCDRYLFAQLILFHIFFAYVFEFWALSYVTSSKAALIFNASPFITALLVRFLYQERLSLKKKIGLMVGFIGFLPILIPQALQEEALGNLFFFSYPELALILAVISACYGWLLFKKLTTQHHYSPLMLNGVGMLGGGLLALLVWSITDGSSPLSPNYFWYTALSKSIVYMSALILIANTICYNLYGFLLRHYSATFLSFAGFLTPLFSAFFGWLFLGELLSWHFFTAACIILIGLALFYMEELEANLEHSKNRYRKKKGSL